MNTQRRGFTLAEVVFATGLIALSLFFMISLIPTANLSLRKGEDLESATLYAQDAIENMRTSVAATPAYPAQQTSALTLNTTDFSMVRTVTAVQTQGTYTLYELTVTLTRTDGKGAPVKLVTRTTVQSL